MGMDYWMDGYQSLFGSRACIIVDVKSITSLSLSSLYSSVLFCKVPQLPSSPSRPSPIFPPPGGFFLFFFAWIRAYHRYLGWLGLCMMHVFVVARAFKIR